VVVVPPGSQGQCTEFVEIVGFLTHEAPDEKGVSKQIQLELSVHKFGELQEGKIDNSAMALETVHVLVVIPSGQLATVIDKSNLKLAWQVAGFEVLRLNRAGLKFGGKRLKGPGTELNRFHLNVKPRDGIGLAEATYPHLLEVKVRGTTQYLEYKMYEHPDLNGMVCLKHCHRQMFAMKIAHLH
jgi:hypothetical protein